jgi:hypothetical protein
MPQSRRGALVRTRSLIAAAVIGVPLSVSIALAQSSSAPPAQSTAPPPPACEAAEHKQFDFWVGRWSVYPKQAPQQKIAESLVEKLYGGCAIRENWMPLKGGGGGSLNAYRPTEGRWRQTWLDAAGSWAEFSGKWNGQAMVLEGPWAQPGKPKSRTRMTYTPHPDGTVEQAGETSDDEGKTWTPSFDLLYRKN